MKSRHTQATQVAEKITGYARCIADYRDYPVRQNGLVPVEDYEHNGRLQPGLKSKAYQKCQDLHDLFPKFSNGEADKYDVMYEFANICYYSIQVNKTFWESMYAGIRHLLPDPKWGRREVEEATDAKFGWRSLAPNNKNKPHEKQLIQERLESLPEKRRGAPNKHDTPPMQYRISTSDEFRVKIQRMAKSEDVGVGTLIEQLVSEHEDFKNFE